ncbi:hypothetical protein J437_LFUL005796 [Ladona fulva]|uniref:Uncharacterized protein n=1 Tax=Ladona fulva TaxID=123851 RepID=A0A8K0K0M3_LADFU|nr:hypothetical protein J437_LFUL005796 [Ladona fulva]
MARITSSTIYLSLYLIAVASARSRHRQNVLSRPEFSEDPLLWAPAFFSSEVSLGNRQWEEERPSELRTERPTAPSADVAVTDIGSSENPTDAEGDQSSEGKKEEYDYDYDLDAALSTFNWAELVPALVVYSLTFVAGVTGNFLIIMATTSCCKGAFGGIESRYGMASASGRLQTPSPTNVFLASLASADLLLILICIPVKVSASLISCFMKFRENRQNI